MRTNVFLLAGALALLSTFGTNVALAQGSDALIEQGLELRRQGRDQDALVRFQQAYNIDHSARALAQIALAEQALGSFVEAELHLSQALAVTVDGWISSRRPALQEALGQIQAQLGTVELVGGANGAQVYVNGELRGTLPEAANLRVRAGTVVVEIRASGLTPVQRQIIVNAGGTAREQLAMVQVQNGGGQPINQGGVYQPGTQTRTVEEHPNWTLFAIGAGVFVVPWVITWATTLALDEGGDLAGLSFIPVLGPFILAASIDPVDGDYLTYLLVIDGIAQAAGIALAVIGLVTRQTEVVVARFGEDREAPQLALRPLNVPGADGVSLALTHF